MKRQMDAMMDDLRSIASRVPARRRAIRSQHQAFLATHADGRVDDAAKALSGLRRQREARSLTEPLSDEEARLHSSEKREIENARTWLDEGRNASGIASEELIERGEEVSRTLDHHLKNASLENTNELYTDKIKEVRDAERVVAALITMNQALGTTPPPEPAAMVSALRRAQSELATLGIESNVTKAFGPALTALGGTDGAALATAMEDFGKTLAAELGMRKDQLGSLAVVSRYVANEAYQSDGPFAHVVTAIQAAEADAINKTVADGVAGVLSEEDRKDLKPEEQLGMAKALGKDAWTNATQQQRDAWIAQAKSEIDAAVAAEKRLRQAALPAEQCLQSFNDQLGDFLKDLEHYGEDDPGKAIVQSSKYLERLLDAVRLMKDKDLFRAAGTVLTEVDRQLWMQDRVKKQLIAARKGQLNLVPLTEGTEIEQAEQRRAFACDLMKRELGVVSVAQLGRTYMRFGVQVNAVARKALASLAPT